MTTDSHFHNDSTIPPTTNRHNRTMPAIPPAPTLIEPAVALVVLAKVIAVISSVVTIRVVEN